MLDVPQILPGVSAPDDTARPASAEAERAKGEERRPQRHGRGRPGRRRLLTQHQSILARAVSGAGVAGRALQRAQMNLRGG